MTGHCMGEIIDKLTKAEVTMICKVANEVNPNRLLPKASKATIEYYEIAFITKRFAILAKYKQLVRERELYEKILKLEKELG